MRWHPTVNVVELDLLRFTYEEKAGREWSRREPRNTDEDQRASSRERANRPKPAGGMKAPLSNETGRNIEAGAGIEPANRFTQGEAILLLPITKQVTTPLTLANVVSLL
jgi:hypothetical protein